MTARILLVDDTPANLRYLEARLEAEYFEVFTASSGLEAVTRCQAETFDLVLLDVMMPGLDGFETCRRLKADPATAHLPVIMVTALDQPSDRVAGLEAGADDFLTKPIDETALLARVRSLIRLKAVTDELRVSALSNTASSFFDPLTEAIRDRGLAGKVLIVDDRPNALQRIAEVLAPQHTVTTAVSAEDLMGAVEDDHDVVVLSLGLAQVDALRVCSQLRSQERTRHIPILLVAEAEDRPRILRGLEIGVNDYIVRPIDANEVRARVRTQVRRRRYMDLLRQTVHASMEMAIVDQLTGLHNRRYFDTHMPRLLEAATDRNRPLCLMILDIDHFKTVNDTYGHDVGDEVLQIFASRLRATVREVDLLCRLGGEEFIIAMPDLPMRVGLLVAERLRLAIASVPFMLGSNGQDLDITVSVGLAERGSGGGVAGLLKRADLALYRSKTLGRNQVSTEAA
ncbi:PleD family two-component system response regulator [Lichenihabitans sp. Uapishka_5]|uniref:PleD family two-component system response regulator n=1 Tax=Lichenihabitans sp. Uapishka_5 TaxID=3037302 RepID=UPI0029E7DCD3|nr:PleD family two-component system response regulator [Lichenihabitans sp. Uapishka_5]MDX7952232.1 PleD family two-component system response regulator [Lichenihabitans sp. Uapishka_5]